MKKVARYSSSEHVIINKIYIIRGERVMLDRDLAELYGVSTGNLNKAIKRNFERFPDDFMFQLSKKEFENLMFQNGISSWGGRRYYPYAFTEQGVAMLSSVLNSDRAIQVNNSNYPGVYKNAAISCDSQRHSSETGKVGTQD